MCLCAQVSIYIHIHTYLIPQVHDEELIFLFCSSICFVPWESRKGKTSFQWQILKIMLRSLKTALGFFQLQIPKPEAESSTSAGGKLVLLCWVLHTYVMAEKYLIVGKDHSVTLYFPSFFFSADPVFYRGKLFPFPMSILSFIFHAKTCFSIFMLAFLICTGWFLLFLSP